MAVLPYDARVARNWHADGTTGAGIAGGGDQQAPDQRFSVETMGFEPTTPCLQSAHAQLYDQVIRTSAQVRDFHREHLER